jgi:hypothetical protein
MEPQKDAAQLNWLARYLPLRKHLGEAARQSLLEVGSGARGIGCVLDAPFVGVDVGFAHPAAAPMQAVVYDGRRLPFADASFHTVVSMDTLEHLSPDRRAAFVGELARVASTQVLVGFPCGEEGRRADEAMARFYPSKLSAPGWLTEHEQHGLPEAADVEAWFEALGGYFWTAVPTTGSLACLLLTLADTLGPLVPLAYELRAQPDGALERWIEGASFGPAFRKVYLLERRSPHEARVQPASLDSTVAALRCPACGGSMKRSGEKVACAGCEEEFGRDEHAALRLVPKPRAVTFVLRPDWLNADDWVPPVHNFLQAFDATEPPRLWLQVDRARLTADQALTLLQPLLEPFGDKPFPELVLADDPAEPPPADAIELSTQGALAGWTVDAFRASARTLAWRAER